MKPVVSHPDADDEWQTSVAFYADRNPELARDFNERVRLAFRQIAATPARFSFVRGFRPLRNYRLRRFPFSVIYLERPTDIWIIAVAHTSRRPAYWKQRLD